MKRVMSFILACLLVIALFPVTAQVEAASGSLDCSGFLSNASHRSYIESKMEYYLQKNSELQTALNNGQSVIFMFEGGSDNYPSHSYSTDSTNLRDQAVVIVVKRSSGSNYIAFHDEACSTIPSQPRDTSGGAEDRQTTILDGIYKVQTCNHQGKYGALNVIVNRSYYTPPSNTNGLVNSCSGINIHTRTSCKAGSGDSAWSWGCQLIGGATDSSNTFNTFMKTVAGISTNVWINYSSKTFNTITAGRAVGYYVVDRQLAIDGLKNLYTTTALNNITAASKTDSKVLTLSDENHPTVLTQGDKFSLKGTLSSGSTLTSVTVGVFDVNGNFKTGVNNANPGGISYDIKASADVSVVFNNLTPGVYYYRIKASNSGGGSVSKDYVFTVLAKDATVSNGTYLIQCKSGSYVADVADHSKSSGANVQAAASGKLPSQAWRVTHANAGYYTIQNVYSGMYLDVAGAGNEDRTNIEQYTGNSSDAQKWQILPTGSGYCLVPKCATSRAMDLSDSATGGNLYIFTAHLGANQRFDLVPISASEYQYTVSFSGNGGANAANVTVLKGDAIGTLPTSTREGYLFDGWFTAPDGGTQISAATVPTANVTYYAHWTEDGPCVGGHTWDDGVVTREANCTETGEKVFTCSVCGEAKTETIPALGHDFETKTTSGACTGYEEITHTCKRCGHVETEINVVNFTDWSTTEPVGVDERLIETKTQYRYSDYQTIISDQPEMSGWTLIKAEPMYGDWGAWSAWSPDKVTDSDTCQVQTETIYGYYYFLCPNCGAHMHVSTKCYTWAGGCGYSTAFPNNWHQMWSTTSWDKANLSDPYGTGHPFTDTTFSGGRWFKWSDNGSARTGYHYRTRTKTMSYTFERWTSPSAWSDEPITETPTRQVEMQKLYRYAQASGDHTWDNGVVTTAPTCQEAGVKTYTCTSCNATRTEEIPALDHDFRNGVCIYCGLTNVTALLKVGTVSGKAGDVVRVPVSIEQNTGFAGFTFEVTADDALVLTDIAKGELLSGSDSGAFTKNVRSGLVNWTDSENLAGDGVLFYLTFKIADDAEAGSYEISIALKDGESSNFVNEYSSAIPFEAENGTVTVKAEQPEPVNPFVDVAKGKFYYEPVLWAFYHDPVVTTGVDATHFAPDRICTRAHVVTFLWRANGCPEPQYLASPFKDVKDMNKYYYKAVLWASEQGITTGYSDGTFRPDDECTRGQVVTFLWRAKGSPKPTGVANPFSDVPSGKYYTNAVLWALQNNITKGRTSTAFGPDDACTRGHVVTFLYRAQS